MYKMKGCIKMKIYFICLIGMHNIFGYYGPPPSPIQPKAMVAIGKKEAMPTKTNKRAL